MRASSRHVAGHEVVEHTSANRYRPYDRLVLRDPKGRTIWTVLSCERSGKSWNITATHRISPLNQSRVLVLVL
jgi:hypothetical protein